MKNFEGLFDRKINNNDIKLIVKMNKKNNDIIIKKMSMIKNL